MTPHIEEGPARLFVTAGEVGPHTGSSTARSQLPALSDDIAADPSLARYVSYSFKAEMLVYLHDLGGDITGLEDLDGERIVV
jgi:hypothetical protein